MKTTIKWMLVLATALSLTTVAFAADDYGVDTRPSPSGYVHANFTTNTGPILIPGSTTTNLPASAAYILPIPKEGFGVFLRTGGTNSVDTTNVTVILEGVVFPTGSRSGGTQVVDNATFVVRTPATASALPTGYDYMTNFSWYVTTATELLRADGVRVRSIQNTNLNSIWISNLFQIR